MQGSASKVSVSPMVPAASALECTSRELRTISLMTEQVQDLVSRLVLDGRSVDVTTLRGLQKLDYVTQSIAAVACFLEGLAETTPASCYVDAVAASRLVILSDLASRLSLAGKGHHASAHHDSAGDCLLFASQD